MRGEGRGKIIKGSEGEEQDLKDDVGVDQIPVKVFEEGVVLRFRMSGSSCRDLWV